MTSNKSKKYFVYHSELPIIPQDLQFIEYNKIKKIKKAKEIFILDLLDFIDNIQKNSFLEEVSSCLDSDGVLCIQATDIYGVSSAVLNNQIDIETYNNLVFSQHKKNISSMGRIITLLKDAGLVILESKFVNGVQYSIKCGKNNA
jgi:hypothetical protein